MSANITTFSKPVDTEIKDVGEQVSTLSEQIVNKTSFTILSLTSYAYNTVAGVQAVFDNLPNQYYGIAHCSFANSYTGTALVSKFNGNYGSYIMTFDDNTQPIHGVHNGTTNYLIYKLSRESI